MTTITPTTSIKSSISFYSKSIKVFQNTDLKFNKSYLLTSWWVKGNWCYVSKRWLLHRSIRRVKSLKRTLYSHPKVILISPYTPLHDVNVTSIYINTRTHILIFYIRQIHVLISFGKRIVVDVVNFLWLLSPIFI